MQILIQSIWGAAQDFAFLTSSSEEVLMLPVTDHTLRSEVSKLSHSPWQHIKITWKLKKITEVF